MAIGAITHGDIARGYETRPASIPLRWFHRNGVVVLQYAVTVDGVSPDGRRYQRVEWADVPDVIDDAAPPAKDAP